MGNFSSRLGPWRYNSGALTLIRSQERLLASIHRTSGALKSQRGTAVLPRGGPVCQQTSKARELSHQRWLHTTLPWKHTDKRGVYSYHTLLFWSVGITTPVEQWKRKGSSFPGPILSSPFCRPTSSCKLCICIAMGHKELHSKNLQNKQQEKANKFYLVCEPSQGNPSDISTNKRYQDTTQS